MKKNYIFYACAAAALVFASCQKEVPSAEVAEPASTDLKVITASAVQTKVTTQDGVNVLWENGDVIKLYTRTWNEGAGKYDASWCDYKTTLNASSATAAFVRDETDTTFVDNTSGKYFAVYRKGAESYIHQSREYYAQIALDKTLTVKNGGDFSASIMCATSEDSEFQFSHVVSYIKFTIDENSTPFKMLTVSPVNASELVVSRIKMNFAGEELITEVLSGNTQDSRTITLTTDDNQHFAPGTYYFAVNPSTYSQGLEFTFTNETSEYSIVSPANVEMTPGAVADMGTIGTLKFPVASDKLGTLYSENGVQGVVFWVDEAQSGLGKIVSGPADNIKWGKVSTYDWAQTIDTDNGAANHEHVLNLDGSSAANYPAVYFCKDLGEGWRLPTVSEMNELIKTYFGIVGDPVADMQYYETEPYKAKAAAFDEVLAQISTDNPDTTYDETKIAMSSNSWYWTGQGDTATKKIKRVKLAQKYSVGAAGATNANFVRCVRDVVLK